MDLIVFTPSELILVARALKDVAQTNGVFSEQEVDFITAIAAMHDVVIEDPQALASITPEELATEITDPHKRKRAIQLLLVMSLVEGEASAAAEEAVRRYSEAFDLNERGLGVVRDVAEGNFLLARFDLVRRANKSLLRGHLLSSLKTMATAKIFGEDRDVAEKYRALAEYPEGSLGRVLYESWREHGFPLPGEKNAMPERGVFHDVGHILSGYGVDPAGEIRQAAFQAGFIRNDGFTFLLFGILQFHIGLRITPIAKGERGYFDVKDVLHAAQRGASCTVDLSDDKAWDFWSVARVPVTELRERYGIPSS